MKRGMFNILVANIIYLFINIINSFLLPKYLSLDTYAILKTYTLYIGYAGFLTLGFSDGMYLKYGGKEIKDIQIDDLSTNFYSYSLLEILVSLLCLIIAIFINDFVLIAFAIGGFFINIIGYYKNLYQAVGDYRLYGRALNYQTILMVILNLVLLFGFHSDNSKLYIWVQVISAFVVMVYLTIVLNDKVSFLQKRKFSIKQIIDNISSGFTLMLGNFSSSIFTSLDRWFIKLLMESTHFAYYSFAVSLENIVNVFVTPITISLYNVFCNNRDAEYILKIKKITLIWGLVIISASFPVKHIIVEYLPQYIDAIPIIFPLFAAQTFYAVIKGIHVNLYKAEHKQKKYFKIMVIMTIIAAILNEILYILFRTVESFAYATFLTALFWFIYCEIEEKNIRFSIKEYCVIIFTLIIYFLSGIYLNSILGILIYLFFLFISVVILMNGTFVEIIKMIIPLLKKMRL